jgi:hypothetical protein
MFRTLLIAGVAMSAVPLLANAAVVNVQLAGTITSASSQTSPLTTSTEVGTGTSFTWLFSYDDAAATSSPGQSSTAVTSSVLTIGTNVWGLGETNFITAHSAFGSGQQSFGLDELFLSGPTVPGSIGSAQPQPMSLTSAVWSVVGQGNQPNGDALPTGAELEEITEAALRSHGTNPSLGSFVNLVFKGSLTPEFRNPALSLQATVFDVTIDGTQVPTPLPAAAWLLLSGLGGLVALTRKRNAL